MKTVQGQIEQYVQSGGPVPPEAAVAARNITEPGLLADMVAYSPDMTTEQRQELLETIDVVERLKLCSAFLARQIEVLELKGKIQSEVKSEMDKTQREYILREQLKAIQRELGEDDPQQAEINELREKVETSGMPEEVRARALKEIDRMSRIPSASPEVGVIRTYVDWLVGLPWTTSTADNLDIKEAAKILDEDHYGLEKVKERILEYLAVRALADKIRSPILCFVGPPGVGKTSLGKSIARAMGRKFVRMSLGGVHDEAEIRGHRRTYIGALPGRVVQSIKTAGTNNPVFMLDEVDKIGMDFRGDPSSALLEVLDPEQNNTFQDNYLEVPFDLSQGPVHHDRQPARPDPAAPARPDGDHPAARLHAAGEDRDRQALPRSQAADEPRPHGEAHRDHRRGASSTLVQAYTHEAGVRNLEREIANVMRKVARQVAEGRKRKTVVDRKKLDRVPRPAALRVRRARGRGPDRGRDRPRRDRGRRRRRRRRGHQDGGQGGLHPHRPARRRHEGVGPRRPLLDPRRTRPDLGIEREVFEKNTLHIHVPAGAIPKDGPSAGITMATAMVSALTGIPVRKDVAMTGEITLRGRVLPIGGLKSKILAAHLSGARIVILPRKNEKDLRDIPEEIRKQIKLILVDSMDQVLEAALRRKPKALVVKAPGSSGGGRTKNEPAAVPAPRPGFPADQPPAMATGRSGVTDARPRRDRRGRAGPRRGPAPSRRARAPGRRTAGEG